MSLAFKDGPPQDGFDLFNSPGHLLNLHKAAGRSKAAHDLRTGLKLGYTGVDPHDISLCLEVDKFDFCLEASQGPLCVTLRPAQPKVV